MPVHSGPQQNFSTIELQDLGIFYNLHFFRNDDLHAARAGLRIVVLGDILNGLAVPAEPAQILMEKFSGDQADCGLLVVQLKFFYLPQPVLCNVSVKSEPIKRP